MGARAGGGADGGGPLWSMGGDAGVASMPAPLGLCMFSGAAEGVGGTLLGLKPKARRSLGLS